MEKSMDETIRCLMCMEDMVSRRTEVTYLGQTYAVELKTCPVCGQVYVPEPVRRKMREVEEILEEK